MKTLPNTQGYFDSTPANAPSRPDDYQRQHNPGFYTNKWHKQPKLGSAGGWQGSQGFHSSTYAIIKGDEGVVDMANLPGSPKKVGRQFDLKIINAGIKDSYDAPSPAPIVPDNYG